MWGSLGEKPVVGPGLRVVRARKAWQALKGAWGRNAFKRWGGAGRPWGVVGEGPSWARGQLNNGSYALIFL